MELLVRPKQEGYGTKGGAEAPFMPLVEIEIPVSSSDGYLTRFHWISTEDTAGIPGASASVSQ